MSKAHLVMILLWALPAGADPASKPATQADIDRLERRLDEQRKVIENLVRLQQQYAAALGKVLDGTQDAAATSVAVDSTSHPYQPSAEPPPRPRPPKQRGSITGTVHGAADAYVYVEDVVASGKGTAAMKQEGKQFVPRVLVVQKGTRVEFPNMDTVFHNVFSVTPDNSFDLGSYRQGESKTVTVVKPGVINVYCNLHAQMVGYILVTPSSLATAASASGTFSLANIPAGHHRIVAWAPNARAVVREVDVPQSGTATIDFDLAASHAQPHLNKDGMPYGSYKE
jgi:plastocyanin